MRDRASLVAAIVVAIALVLSGCGGMTPDPIPAAPSLDGTWFFAGFAATIVGESVTVTVGDGTMPLSMDPPYSQVTQIVVKGVLAVDGMAYKLTLSEDADAITVMPEVAGPLVVPALKGLIQTAQAGTVMITVDADADPNTITVKGSFIVTLASALGSPATEVVGCKGAPCVAS